MCKDSTTRQWKRVGLTEVQCFYKSRGICTQRSILRIPEQNGVPEQQDRTFCELAHAKLKSEKFPKSLWCETTATATHIYNRPQTSAAGNIILYEHWNRQKPDVSYFRVFGCVFTFPGSCAESWRKKASKVTFVGYLFGIKRLEVL